MLIKRVEWFEKKSLSFQSQKKLLFAILFRGNIFVLCLWGHFVECANTLA